jgi:hypothetical protein
MRLQSVFSFCKEEGVTDKTISVVFFNLCSLGNNLRQTKYSLRSMTFFLHVQIHPFTALEDTYALLFMHIASSFVKILCSEGKEM